MASRRLWLVLFALVLGAYLLVPLQGRKTLGAGSRLDELRAELSDGTVLDLASYRGQVVVLTFWASWCGPCRVEAPVLSRLHARGVRVFGLGVEPHPLERLVRDARAMGADYPVGQPGLGALERLRVSVVPTTYVLDRSGAVAFGRAGLVPEDELEAAVAAAERR